MVGFLSLLEFIIGGAWFYVNLGPIPTYCASLKHPQISGSKKPKYNRTCDLEKITILLKTRTKLKSQAFLGADKRTAVGDIDGFFKWRIFPFSEDITRIFVFAALLNGGQVLQRFSFS
jgi:hypothetical protein